MTLDERFMREALRLARLGAGRTFPNPCVGAVVVRGGRIVGRGWHHAAGLPHAEVEAIEDARRKGRSIRGVTLYVTLEPCSTWGRTPPCTDLILRNGIRRVVAGATDPNPRHAGRGFRILRRAGVRVTCGVLGPECVDLNRAWNHWIVKSVSGKSKGPRDRPCLPNPRRRGRRIPKAGFDCRANAGVGKHGQRPEGYTDFGPRPVFWAQDEIAADIAPRPKRRRLPKIGSNATPWTFQIRSKRRPWVIAKCGMTLDGKIATADGESRWITGEPARREAHRLRSRVDAVLVGINTVLHDDPSLTVRLPRWKGKQPWRVVLDRQARMPVRAKMLRDGHPERVWIFVGTRAAAARVDRLVAAGAKVTRVKVRAGSLDLGEVLRELGRHEVGSLLVEGGGSVLGSFVREKRVNEAVFFIAPMVLGGARSVKAVGGKGFERWRDSLGVTVREVRRCGDDLMICGVVGEEV